MYLRVKKGARLGQINPRHPVMMNYTSLTHYRQNVMQF